MKFSDQQRAPYDLVVYGATGFTGCLVARYLADLSERKHAKFTWAIAGRSQKKLRDVQKKLGVDVPIIVADSNDLEALKRMTRQCRAIASTVGPYLEYGQNLVEACVDTGTNYCDLTGEPPFISQMVKAHHAAAEKKGVKIVNCCGFDCIPSDLGAFLCTDHLVHSLGAKGALKVKGLVTVADGGASGGTINSAMGAVKWAHAQKGTSGFSALVDPYLLCPSLPTDSDLRVDTKDSQKWAPYWDSDWGTITLPWVMASVDNKVIRRSAVLRKQQVEYDEAMSVGAGMRASAFMSSHYLQDLAAGVRQDMQCSSTNSSSALARNILKKLNPLPAAGEGPSDSVQKDGSFAMQVMGTGSGASGSKCQALVEVKGHGDPGYAATAALLAESALCLALDQDMMPQTSGVLTPSTAMGKALVTRLEQTGRFSFKVMDGFPFSYTTSTRAAASR